MKTDEMIVFVETIEDDSGFISKGICGDKSEFIKMCEEIIEEIIDCFKPTQNGRQ